MAYGLRLNIDYDIDYLTANSSLKNKIGRSVSSYRIVRSVLRLIVDTESGWQAVIGTGTVYIIYYSAIHDCEFEYQLGILKQEWSGK